MIEGPPDITGLRERLAELRDPTGLLEEIFAGAPVGLQIYAPDGRSILVNPAHTALFGGVPPPEYNIFQDTILVERGVADLVRRAFAGERIKVPAFWYDIRDLRNIEAVHTTGGRRIAAAAQLVPLRDSNNVVAHVLIVFHDQTAEMLAREQAEAAAAAAETRAAQASFLADASRVLSSSLDFDVTLSQVARLATPALADFCIVDLVNEDGSFRRVAAAHANPERQAIIDELRRQFPAHPGSPQPAARVIGSGQPELLPEVDARVLLEHTQNEEHRQLMQRLDVRSHLAVPLQIGERTLGAISLGFVGTRRYSLADVALVEALASRAAVAIDNAHLYRAAEAARADAEAASQAKDEFLAMLGHELRNPLAPIVTALELTRARDGASRERTIIERQVDHLRRLVDDLLDVARITRGALELDRRPLDLIEAVTDGVELARPLVDERRHRLEVAVPPGLIVFGDRVRLAQIVANLVTNAARYSESGSEIRISATRVDREISLRVRDTGTGISAELLPHVFETFTRGTRAIDRAAGGLGIGLAIVKSLTTLHGGRAIARSSGPGQGSELEIVLPALEVSAPAPQARTAAEPITAAPRAGLVLVVDDNIDAAELLGDVLSVHGFEVVVTYDPYEALALAKARRPSIALVDLGLPGMDGYELARELRADPALAGLVLVALTGFGQRSDRERTTAAGFREHLVKPIKLDQLVPILETLLTR